MANYEAFHWNFCQAQTLKLGGVTMQQQFQLYMPFKCFSASCNINIYECSYDYRDKTIKHTERTHIVYI